MQLGERDGDCQASEWAPAIGQAVAVELNPAVWLLGSQVDDAEVVGAVGDSEAAVAELEQLLRDYQGAFGPNHPETLILFNLAHWLREANRAGDGGGDLDTEGS